MHACSTHRPRKKERKREIVESFLNSEETPGSFFSLNVSDQHLSVFLDYFFRFYALSPLPKHFNNLVYKTLSQSLSLFLSMSLYISLSRTLSLTFDVLLSLSRSLSRHSAMSLSISIFLHTSLKLHFLLLLSAHGCSKIQARFRLRSAKEKASAAAAASAEGERGGVSISRPAAASMQDLVGACDKAQQGSERLTQGRRGQERKEALRGGEKERKKQRCM